MQNEVYKGLDRVPRWWLAFLKAFKLASSDKVAGSVGSQMCSKLSSYSNVHSMSALAAVAYTATIPVLAEKAIKAVLSAMQPCSIKAHSAQAALRALFAHLSSTNSKYVCEDAVMFIVTMMHKYRIDVVMQTEGCLALCSLSRAISSVMGHNVWSTIIDAMQSHRNSLVVQRAGCNALQVLCTRAFLGVPEWSTTVKRPQRASKDMDREMGIQAIITAMSCFPEDIRIQWYGCSTLWTLVHSAGFLTVANIIRNGALSVVAQAMSVCRMNAMVPLCSP